MIDGSERGCVFPLPSATSARCTTCNVRWSRTLTTGAFVFGIGRFLGSRSLVATTGDIRTLRFAPAHSSSIRAMRGPLPNDEPDIGDVETFFCAAAGFLSDAGRELF